MSRRRRNYIGQEPDDYMTPSEEVDDLKKTERKMDHWNRQAETGMSAPISARDTTPSARTQSFRDIFPNAPTSQPFMSAPSRISARDAAILAGPKVQQVRYAAAPSAPIPTSDAEANRISARNMAYYTGGMGKQTVGAPRLDPRAVARLDDPTAAIGEAPQATLVARADQRTASAPIALDPRLPAATVSDTGIVRLSPQEQKTMREATLGQYPDIGKAGTPLNAAFVAYAKANGEASAHANLGKIVASIPGAPKNLTIQTGAEQGTPSLTLGDTSLGSPTDLTAPRMLPISATLPPRPEVRPPGVNTPELEAAVAAVRAREDAYNATRPKGVNTEDQVRYPRGYKPGNLSRDPVPFRISAR